MSETDLNGAQAGPGGTEQEVADEVREEVENPPAPDAAPPLGDDETPTASESPPPESPADVAGEDPVSEVARQRDDYLDALRRLQADFENYKKRMVRQQTEHLERAAEGLVGKLLPVLDTADLALAHQGGDAVAQLRSSLLETLSREGLERIDPVDQPFDPAVADAVAHEPGDDGPLTVIDVMRAGYRWKGRVLRPAMVKVRG
jgi:molecular chaperone GrpE